MHSAVRPLRRARPLPALLVLALLPAALSLPALLRGEIPWFMDTLTCFYPLRMHAAGLLWNGEMPFWNRTQFAGVPFLANPQWGLLYPGHWPFLLLPGPRSFALVNAAHAALLGAGVFLWMRRLAAGRIAGALAAGLLLELGGWTAAHLAFGAYLQVAAWMPWTLFAWERFRRAGSSRPAAWAVLAGLCGAFQILAGAPQLALYCLSGSACFILAQTLIPPRRKTAAAAIRFLSVQGLVAIGLSAPQWMPTLAFMADCERTGVLPLDRVLQGTLDARGLLRALIGGTGRPEDAESILYPGLAALALVLPALLAAGRRNALPALGVMVLAMAAAWTPLVAILHPVLPVFSRFHDPKRILFIAFFFSAVLAGRGVQVLWNGVDRLAARAPHAAAVLRPALVLLILAAAADPLLFTLRNIDVRTIPAADFSNPADCGPLRPGDRFFALDAGIQYSYNYTRADFGASLLPNLAALHGLEDIQGYDPLIPWRHAVYLRRLNASPAPSVTLYPAHFSLVRNPDSPWLPRFGEVRVRGAADRFHPFLPPAALGPGERLPVSLLRGDRLPPALPAASSVTLVCAIAWRHDDPPPSLGLSLRKGAVRLAEGVAVPRLPPAPALPPGRVPWNPAPLGPGDLLWPDVLRGEPSASAGPVREFILTLDTRAWPDRTPDTLVVENQSRAGVLVYAASLPWDAAPYRLLPENTRPPTFVSTAQPGFPPSVVLQAIGPVAPDQRLAYEKWARNRPVQTVTVEIPPGDPLATAPPSPTTLRGWKWEEKRANRLAVSLPAPHPAGWLVLPEPYAPGWTCTVDGRPAPIYPADTLFRAVPVGADASRVVMRYRPPGFVPGLLTAAAALLAAVLLVRRKRRNGTRPKRTPHAD